jgi:anti-sigma-K factor RskA
MVDPQPHREAHPDVAGYLLGTLDEAEARAFAEHLPGCQACRSELAELAGLPGLLAQAAPAEVLPAELEQRTFAAIEAAALEADRPQGETVEISPTSPMTSGVGQRDRPAAVIPMDQAHRGGRRARARVMMAAAAALVAVAIGLGVLASVRKGSQSPIATIRLISATGGSAHATATILTSPAGLVIDMQVDGLAPNPPGTMYTCWLVGPGDTLAHQNRVSVGSFVVHANQSVHVRWTTAADIRHFPHMGVTVEPDNGDPRHQGAKVLAGP